MDVRFLYLIGQLGGGGAERQLYNLLKHSQRERFKATVCVWNYAEDEVYVHRLRALGVPVLSLPRTRNRLRKLRAFRQMVSMARPEVVHSYSFYTNVAAYFGARGSSALAIGSVRSDFLRDRSKGGLLLGSLNARWPRRQIFNSYNAREHAERSRGPFVPAQCYVVRNGIDLDVFSPRPVPDEPGAPILGIGSLVPVKRWDRLVKATALLKRRGVDCTVEIIGEGRLQPQLEALAHQLDVQDRVHFSGYQPDVPTQLHRALFLVHPSDTEGCPNVVMEAMACGRAVVATRVGESKYLVEHERSGFLVDREDIDALADGMETLIRQPALRRRMGIEGRIKAEEQFSLTRLVEQTHSVYRAAGWRGPGVPAVRHNGAA